VGEEEWLEMDSFPATQDLVLAQVISEPWRREYDSVLELRDAIHSFHDRLRE
jgi:hypothetical protein